MAVHLLRLPTTEPAKWLEKELFGTYHIAPQWPASDRFVLIAVVRGPGPRDHGHTRAFWVGTAEEMDALLTNHTCKILWFTVARHKIKDDMIEQTLPDKEGPSV